MLLNIGKPLLPCGKKLFFAKKVIDYQYLKK
jgi:hypothetical protein